MHFCLKIIKVIFLRLGDAHKRGFLTENEVQNYLDKGYLLTDQVDIESGRPGAMIFISYMALDSFRHWTVKSGETQMGYIGQQDLTNAGQITNQGEVLFLYDAGRIVNTGKLTNTGRWTLRPMI
jgi:hypothetical protein